MKEHNGILPNGMSVLAYIDNVENFEQFTGFGLLTEDDWEYDEREKRFRIKHTEISDTPA